MSSKSKKFKKDKKRLKTKCSADIIGESSHSFEIRGNVYDADDLFSSINSSGENPPKKRRNIGGEMMAKMGFHKGEGLGKYSQGNIDIIQPPNQRDRKGLGYSADVDVKLDPIYKWDPEKEKGVIEIPENIKWLKNHHNDTLKEEFLKNCWRAGKSELKFTDQIEFCDEATVKGVITCKTALGHFTKHQIKVARAHANPFECIDKSIFMNRAAVKIANIDSLCDFMFSDPKDLLTDPCEPHYFADLCAGPGGFSEYMLWKKGWETKGFAITLKEGIEIKLNKFCACGVETFETYYGDEEKSDGNIYEPKNILAFRNYVLKNTNGKGAHICMADGGFSVVGQEEMQETLSKRLYLCQFACGLGLIRNRGHFVCKLFDIFTLFSVGLIYLMYRCFSEITIIKPNSSRPASSERYIVCKSKYSNTHSIEKYFFEICCRMDQLAKENKGEEIMEIFPLEDIKKDINFYRYIYELNSKIGCRQIIFLSKLVEFIQNKLSSNIDLNLKEKCLQLWKLPLSQLIFRKNILKPNELLMRITSESKCYINEAISHLTLDDLNSLEYPWNFKCIVLCDNKKSNYKLCGRGYFLGCGGTLIYYWNGLKPVNWVKYSDGRTIELPYGTLIFGEHIKEFIGEGKGQRVRCALHIIDVLSIGNTDVNKYLFSERNKLAQKLVRSLMKNGNTTIRVKKVYDLPAIEKLFTLDIDMKELKGGTESLCHIMEKQSNTFIIPSGLLFLNEFRNNWNCMISKSKGLPYYFNVKTRSPSYPFCPSEAIAEFPYILNNAFFWAWGPIEELMDKDQLPENYKLDKSKVNRETLRESVYRALKAKGQDVSHLFAKPSADSHSNRNINS